MASGTVLVKFRLGLALIVMLLCGVQNLREITLFPMNQQAQNLLMGAPSPASAKQLRELSIRLNVQDKYELPG